MAKPLPDFVLASVACAFCAHAHVFLTNHTWKVGRKKLRNKPMARSVHLGLKPPLGVDVL
eukprot:1160508-Pelagomonas_calceolata.AAC.10